jgi:polysaccharide biosynthesis transport protein
MNIKDFTLTPSVRSSEPLEREGDDINRLIAIFRRRARLFISVVVLVMAGVLIVTSQTPRRYTAVATVMIDSRKRDVSDIQQVMADLPANSDAVDTEVEILKSRTLAGRVVDALRLDQDPEFNSALRPPSAVSEVLHSPAKFISGVFGGQPSKPSGANQLALTDVQRTIAHDAVVDQVLADLTVKRSGTTFVIDIGFTSRNSARAAEIANAFADKYLLEQLEAKLDATQQATLWLNQRLAELQPQVESAQAAVEQYKAQHGLLASVGSSLTEQEISNLNTELDQAKADMAEKDARVRSAKSEVDSGATGENLTGSLSSATMMQLRGQQATASSKVADLQTKYGPKHPEVQRAERELADINAAIAQEVSRNVANLQSESDVAHQRVASLEGSLSGAKGTLVGNNAASVELADLQRRADAASTLYDSLLGRAKEISVDQGNEQSDARVVSHAKIPLGPSSPNQQLNLTLGLVLGLALGAGVVMLLEALDNGLTTSEDVERYFGLPHLGAIPLMQSTMRGKSKGRDALPHDHLVDAPLSAFAESFRNLRASILFSKVDAPVRIIAVTSALPGEGKTTTAVCLARSMALSGAKVVVVDCDLRRRSISKALEETREHGLIELLQGSAGLEDVLIPDGLSEAQFLPLAESAYTPKDLFGSAAMDRLLEDLRQRFDFVLLDTAPVIPVSDTRVLAPKADVVVFLAQWRRTPRKAIHAAMDLLTSVGADVAGIALTLVDVRGQARYGYGDAGYYYEHYRRYYSQ